jgi:hypothetical protein
MDKGTERRSNGGEIIMNWLSKKKPAHGTNEQALKEVI